MTNLVPFKSVLEDRVFSAEVPAAGCGKTPVLGGRFWVAQRFQRCDKAPFLMRGFSPRGTQTLDPPLPAAFFRILLESLKTGFGCASVDSQCKPQKA